MTEAFQPIPAGTHPRFTEPATFMRLPWLPEGDPRRAQVELGLIGIPFDLGVSNRPGTRHGPRQVRDMSTLIRRAHRTHHLYPFDLARCADLGDSLVNPADVQDSLAKIEASIAALRAQGTVPLCIGGDHLVTLPVLRGLKPDRPLGLVHFDSHSDTWDSYYGGWRYTHGTPFRRAIEEGLLDPKRCIQIGIRGSMYDLEDNGWAEAQGVRIIYIEDYWKLGPEGAAAEARRVVGDGPAYLTFDIDALDPAYAPGTGTPEIGGYSPAEAQRMLRGLMGLDLVGADLVEVSPPFDPQGGTAMVAANLLFEILCLLAARIAARRG
jgi:guanidinopropionase